MPRLAVATTNRGKLREIADLLNGLPFELVTLAEWPDVAAPEENGRTFAENARLKALYYAAHTGGLTVAEDSGLEIDGWRCAGSSRRFQADSLTLKFDLITAGCVRTVQAMLPGARRASFVRWRSCATAGSCSNRVASSKAGSRRNREGAADLATTRSSFIRRSGARWPRLATARPP
jgi:inosine/xanthosine triphosphate pyrophosphatase family protein